MLRGIQPAALPPRPTCSIARHSCAELRQSSAPLTTGTGEHAPAPGTVAEVAGDGANLCGSPPRAQLLTYENFCKNVVTRPQFCMEDAVSTRQPHAARASWDTSGCPPAQRPI